jgi:hypothetical protein
MFVFFLEMQNTYCGVASWFVRPHGSPGSKDEKAENEGLHQGASKGD